MKWVLLLSLFFISDTTNSVKLDFKDVKAIIIQQARDQKRQDNMDKMLIKLDSILMAIPDSNDLKK